MESTLRSPPEKEASDENDVEPGPARPFSRLFAAFIRLRTFEALRYREFRLLWLGEIFRSMATWMDQVARGWLIYELTDSTVQLGLVRGVQAIPVLLLSPVAGSAADRLPRKIQVMVAQLLDGLMFAVVAALIISEEIRPWHVYVTAFAMACVQTFQQPARAAMVADAVPSSHLTNAIGLNSIVFNLARSTGPAVAGVLIATFGTAGSYVAQAAFYFMATAWTAQIRMENLSPSESRGRGRRHGSFGRSILEGWKFSWRNETVRAGLLITMFASFFIIPFTTLLPVFARDLLGVGATGQGLLLTAMGLGALCSAFLIASLGDRMQRGVLMLAGVSLYGIGVIAFSASRWFELSLVLMAITGATHVSSHALVQTVIQTYSPSELRGRTMAIFQMGHVLLTLGSLFIGSLALLVGARWAVALMGAAGALAILAIAIALPRTRYIR
ncbi:MAG TPA: MFS transporter [Candidatus Acidoferrales bacterium]|nr:MFS transporter [Candidatus Acidoferrales bacterium]